MTPSSPLRVLFVNGNVGGHVTMHQHLERGLRGHEDVAASFLNVDRAGLAREVLAARIPLLNRLDLDLKQLRFQIGIGVWVRSRLRGRLGQFDVLHIYPHDVGLLCARFVRQMPTVVSLDAPNSESFLLLPYRRPTRWTPRILRLSMRLEQRLFRAATLIVAQSEWAARALERDYGIDRAKIRVIRFGIAQPPEIAPAATEGVPQITFVGRTMGRKGGWRLLDVFRDRLREFSRLNLVTQETVAPEPNVRVFNDFVPGDSRLTELLGQTSVFALPSDTDMSPYSVLEAMACGIPVVACRVGAVPEMVEDGVTGLLVEPGDDEGLGAALATLLRDAHLRHQMGEAAKARFSRCFDAAVTTEALVEVLKEATVTFVARGRVANRTADATRARGR